MPALRGVDATQTAEQMASAEPELDGDLVGANNAVGPGTSTTSLIVAWSAPGCAATTTAHCHP